MQKRVKVTHFGTSVAYSVPNMEYKRQLNRRLIRKAINLVVFGLFTANAHAQILFGPPGFVVQPVGISVQNGDTTTLTMSAASVPLPITTVTWYCNGNAITNSNVTVATLNIGASATSSLIIKNFSTSTAGNYTVKVANKSGSVTSSNAVVISLGSVVGNTVSNLVSVVTSATGMVAKGFKLQFTAPIGSNVVIQATSDMSNWSSISTNTCTTGSVTITDAVAKVVSCRFYRARIQ